MSEIQCKRIIFWIIGNQEVGLGHIYRALTLALELRNHEVLFVTDTENHSTVKATLKKNYWLGVVDNDRLTDFIIGLRPDMVICDILDTDEKDIKKINSLGSPVVSFEDLGSGAMHTDLTVNEIYDTPQFESNHILWGSKYFFLRDEFRSVRPQRFRHKVDSVMLTFGGTDQHDLARKVFFAIKTLCEELDVFVHIVTGPGYRGYKDLKRMLNACSGVSLTHDSEVISSIMEQVQLAITSNGRTVYELAHMNIPAIVIAQHQRELTHSYASESNGFVPLGIYQPNRTEQLVSTALERLINDEPCRRGLFDRMTELEFNENKLKVVSKLQGLLGKDMSKVKMTHS